MSDDFKIDENTLVYEGGDPSWNTIAGVELQIANSTTTDLSFEFTYSDNSTTQVDVLAGGSAPFSLAEKAIIQVSVTEQGAPAGDIIFGPTVKHMSKGGGQYQRLDWTTSQTVCAMHNIAFTDKVMESDMAGWDGGRDANYTFELIMHDSLDGDGSFAISMSRHYTISTPPRVRAFWYVDASGNLALTPKISAASWFTRSSSSTPFEIHHDGGYLARMEVRGDAPKLFISTNQADALSLTLTAVNWVYPRELRTGQ